jgi:hypothetical protein
VTQRKRSAVERRLIEGFVQRSVETEAPLLAADLQRYAKREGLSWEELARSLDGTSEALHQVALCRPPRPEQFAEDVATIAAGSVDADRLLMLLRRIQVLGSFTGLPAASPARQSSEIHGMLLAARDREDAEEHPEADARAEGADRSAGDADGSTGERQAPHE